MRRLSLIVVSIASAVMLAGCGNAEPAAGGSGGASGDVGAAMASNDALNDGAAGNKDAIDSAFLTSLENEGLGDIGPDASKVDLAHRVCDLLNGHLGFDFVANKLMDAGFTPMAAGTFIRLTAASYCPGADVAN